jgi:RNA polymerase sigma-70 factor (ECF subfamily)
MADSFHDQMIAILPKLRVQALALSRNRSAADDLVQEAVAKALAARHSFEDGTNFNAWMHRILRNTFISWIRRRRETQDLEHAPADVVGVPGNAFDNVVVRELNGALAKLSPEQRESLVMVSVQGLSYEQVAAITGVAVGTAKCRVFRARRLLQAMLMGEEREVATETAAQEADGWTRSTRSVSSSRASGRRLSGRGHNEDSRLTTG